jgi:hypothetical protein
MRQSGGIYLFPPKRDSGAVGKARSGRSWRLSLTTLLLCLFAALTTAERRPSPRRFTRGPNVLFILADDQALQRSS